MTCDLELKELPYFTGTTSYQNYMGINLTDGVQYIAENGYHWFMSDMVVILAMKLRTEPFCSVKLKLGDDNSAVATIEDGNGKVLHKQNYKITDAKKELTLFYSNGVLMLASEY